MNKVFKQVLGWFIAAIFFFPIYFWITVSIKKDKDIFELHIAHNEGNFFASETLLNELKNDGRIAFKYIKEVNNDTDYNPNGSSNDIAGILSKNGRVLGMMLHPERAINNLHGGTDGLKFLTKSFEQIIG